ncbi:MAG: TrkA family potassium uptake protein [Chloroflexi bacterium]|nr:TrkA family potassium uptake protein [Chloroflexota bacterium]
MKKQVVVIGLGRFGVSLASALSGTGHDVLALDTNERKVQSVAAQITHAVVADATDEAVLNELGVRNSEIAVVAIGSDIQSSVLTALLLKRLGIPCVIARASNRTHGEILKKIGVDDVVYPEHEAGDRLAHEIRLGNVSDYLPVTPRYGIAKLEPQAECVGQTLGDIGLGPKGRESVAGLLVQRGNEVIIAPSLSEVIKAGDRLVVAGSDDKLESFLARIMARRKDK